MYSSRALGHRVSRRRLIQLRAEQELLDGNFHLLSRQRSRNRDDTDDATRYMLRRQTAAQRIGESLL
jgi:hypothetical protein